jgi:hypothetical protein
MAGKHSWFLEHIEPHTPLLKMIHWLQQDDPDLTEAECRALIIEAQKEHGWTKAQLVK